MDTNGISLSDIAAVTNGGEFGNNSWIMLILFALIFGWGGNGFGNRGDYGQFATAASQQDILFGQKFSDLDNKIDRIGNGIADATFALNNTINGVQTNLGNAIVAEGRATQTGICELKSAIHEEGEATRALIQQNKIDALQAQVNELKTQQMFCGVPKINPYGYQVVPNNNCCCGNNL